LDWNKKIGLLRFPASSAGAIPMYNLVDILSDFSNYVYVISGNKSFELFDFENNVETYHIDYRSGNNFFSTIIRYISAQIKLTFGLFNGKKIKNYIFYTNMLIIPLFIGKIIGKNIILYQGGFAHYRANISNSKYKTVIYLIYNLCFTLADGIIVATPRLIDEWGIEKYSGKIYFCHEHIIDTKEFNINKDWSDRRFEVGYIGRFESVKNVLNYVKAIPLLLEEKRDFSFLIGGEGSQKDDVLNFINENNLQKYVSYVGWISHSNLSKYLNEIKLLILPSNSEGLPNILLEAMACGTPVLAHPVGSIPDIIEHGKNGFLLKDNSPSGIAEGVSLAFEHEDITNLVISARKTVESKFDRQNTIKNFKKTLEKIYKKL